MVKMTFDEYDALQEKAEGIEIPDDFKYPSLEAAQEMIADEAGLIYVLQAYLNTPDKNYRKELQQFLYREIELIEKKEEPEPEIDSVCVKGRLVLTAERNSEIMDVVRGMDFQLNSFFPSKKEIDAYVANNSEENLAFLYWVLNAPISDLTAEEESTKAYIQKLIKRRVKIIEGEK